MAFTAIPCIAQTAFPPTGATSFRDTSLFKPPAGSKLAIIEFEDLECYTCGQASPIVYSAMEKYNIPRVHHDFLISSHVWSRTAAIQARYLEDKLSPKIAEAYRRDVFANQSSIASPDDLQQFTSRWFQAHNLQMPFAFDASGICAKQVDADCLRKAHWNCTHSNNHCGHRRSLDRGHRPSPAIHRSGHGEGVSRIKIEVLHRTGRV